MKHFGVIKASSASSHVIVASILLVWAAYDGERT